eukprot:s39_g41.t1
MNQPGFKLIRGTPPANGTGSALGPGAASTANGSHGTRRCSLTLRGQGQGETASRTGRALRGGGLVGFTLN